MSQLLTAMIAALGGAAMLGLAAETNTLLGAFMGAVLGAAAAVMIAAFPTDLDYRERRVWPPRER
jgi:hypothetical protein